MVKEPFRSLVEALEELNRRHKTVRDLIRRLRAQGRAVQRPESAPVSDSPHSKTAASGLP